MNEHCIWFDLDQNEVMRKKTKMMRQCILKKIDSKEEGSQT
jgi:hypothetical protein